MWEIIGLAYALVSISQFCTNLSALYLALISRDKNRSKDAKRICDQVIAQRRRRVMLAPAWPAIMVFDTCMVIKYLLFTK